MYKDRILFNYKKYKHLLQDTGDTALRNVTVEEKCPTVADILASSIAKYITLARNKCGYSGTAEDLKVNHVNPFLF